MIKCKCGHEFDALIYKVDYFNLQSLASKNAVLEAKLKASSKMIKQLTSLEKQNKIYRETICSIARDSEGASTIEDIKDPSVKKALVALDEIEKLRYE